jgi:hypothetical protein
MGNIPDVSITITSCYSVQIRFQNVIVIETSGIFPMHIADSFLILLHYFKFFRRRRIPS